MATDHAFSLSDAIVKEAQLPLGAMAVRNLTYPGTIAKYADLAKKRKWGGDSASDRLQSDELRSVVEQYNSLYEKEHPSYKKYRLEKAEQVKAVYEEHGRKTREILGILSAIDKDKAKHVAERREKLATTFAEDVIAMFLEADDLEQTKELVKQRVMEFVPKYQNSQP